jgi:putative tributyrin esterase
MAIATIQFFSRALNRHVEYNALLPETGTGPFPVVMQLHGLTDNHWSWIHRSRFIHDLERESLIVILPDGGTSAYFDWPSAERLGKQDYEAYLTRDLVDHVRRHLQARPGPWGIGGLSMGGYGAMRLGLRHPELFASVWSHSSAFRIHDYVGDAAGAGRRDIDLFAVATDAATGRLPVIGFDCGVDDEGLIDDNRDFAAHLRSLAVPFTYHEHPGGHDWPYWDAWAMDGFRQHRRVLGG